MTESDRQKGREISAGTVTNKSLQHDRRLLKHFISPQHNGVLLPIICSVSARVDIKWGAAAFSCHFSAVSPLPWRPTFLLLLGAFFYEPGCEQRGGCTCARGGSKRHGVVGAKDKREAAEEHKEGKGMSLAPSQAAKTAISNTLLRCKGADCQACVQCFDFHIFWQLSLHPFALFLSLHPVSHKSDSNPPLLSSTSAVVS